MAAKGKRGRPSGSRRRYETSINVPLTEDQKFKLELWASQEEVSVAAYIRSLAFIGQYSEQAARPCESPDTTDER